MILTGSGLKGRKPGTGNKGRTRPSPPLNRPSPSLKWDRNTKSTLAGSSGLRAKASAPRWRSSRRRGIPQRGRDFGSRSGKVLTPHDAPRRRSPRVVPAWKLGKLGKLGTDETAPDLLAALLRRPSVSIR